MKFYWYNQKYIQEYLRYKFKNINAHETDLGSNDYKELYKINCLFSNNPWGLIQDISGNVEHPFNIKSNVVYNFKSTTDTFDQISLNAANKIASITDKKICVNWSGGIDSTVALVALAQTTPLNRLVVVCNEDSIAEFPNFYHNFIKKNIKTISPTEWFNSSLDYFTVSGDAGDTVWGTIDQTFWDTESCNFDLPWIDWISKNKQNLADLEFVEKFCSWSGVEIKTVIELRIWFYLCCKWQDKAMKLYRERPELSSSTGVPFYNVDNSFQNWTMNNLDCIVGNKWTAYKVPAKQFIDKFFKDSDYLSNKTKMDSTSNLNLFRILKLVNKKADFALDENYNSHILPSWPLVDIVQFEDWNDQHQLIPQCLLQT